MYFQCKENVRKSYFSDTCDFLTDNSEIKKHEASNCFVFFCFKNIVTVLSHQSRIAPKSKDYTIYKFHFTDIDIYAFICFDVFIKTIPAVSYHF